MENATKALLIAAGMLLAVMILSIAAITYKQVSSYYSEKQDIIFEEQAGKFNKRFEDYNRERIRGSDIVSLVNMVIDYNTNESFETGTNYKRIKLEINMIDNSSVMNQFRFITSQNSASDYGIPSYKSILPDNNKISNAGATNTVTGDQLSLKTLTNQINKMIADNSSLGFSDSTLQRLSTNISNIVLLSEIENRVEGDTATDYEKSQITKRTQLIKNILKLKDNQINTANMVKIKTATCQYYEFTQFKRAYFDCEEIKYDEETGRVCEMKFKVRLNSNGTVEFN